jgi:hypothetical protein
MRHNGRSAVAISTLPPGEVSLFPGEPVMVACPICGKWRRVARRMLWPHRAHDGITRCPGSGQRLVLDLSPGEWAVRLEAARREARRARSLHHAVRAELARRHVEDRAAAGRAG